MIRNDPPTRRGVLAAGAAVALGALAGCSESPSAGTTTGGGTTAGTATDAETGGSPVETVVSIPGERVPENMAFDGDGNLYFGITAGEVRRLEADLTGETGLTLDDTELVATLPGAIGVETGPDGSIYVAVAADDDRGVWEVPTDGQAAQLVDIEGFPNDLLYDAGRDRLLVTESNDGVVYEVGGDGSRTTWLDDDRLDTESFGANGITRDDDGDVFVSVTRAPDETGRLLQVPVRSDGTAGDATTFFEGGAVFGADGITTRNDDVFVAANSQNRVVSVSPDGSTATVADGDDGLVFPSDVLFGHDEAADTLFVCNFANQSPDDGAILRTRVGQS